MRLTKEISSFFFNGVLLFYFFVARVKMKWTLTQGVCVWHPQNVGKDWRNDCRFRIAFRISRLLSPGGKFQQKVKEVEGFPAVWVIWVAGGVEQTLYNQQLRDIISVWCWLPPNFRWQNQLPLWTLNDKWFFISPWRIVNLNS